MSTAARLLAVLLLALSAFTAPAHAQGEAQVRERAEDIVAVIRGDAVYGDVFADTFVAAVSASQFGVITRSLTTQVGPVVGLEYVETGSDPGAATVAIRFERAIVSGPMRLEPTAPYKVAGLLLNNLAPVNDAGLSVLEQVQALPGDTAMLFARLDGSQVLAAHNVDEQMAIGSTFKLWVLSALSQSIARGERQWSDVVTLDQRSFPSGQLQDWPQGAPLTLHTLASLMVSISDNTATDQVMAVLGRAAVEAELAASGHADPDGTLPYMTTRELFLLKLGADDVLEDYEDGDVEERREILATLADRPLDMAEVQRVFGSGPRFIGVEWFASTADIARVFARLAADPVALDILTINLGIDSGRFADWDYVGYKGGSEPGVLNLSWLLRDAGGAWWVLSFSWNNADAAVSEAELIALAQAALAEHARAD